MIDVIIPVYNDLVALKIVLFSFSLQTINHDEFRIIVVDDGSDDGLNTMSWTDLCNTYDLQGVIIHQKNLGRSAARNRGLNESTADIIIFCDADRFPDKDFVEQHLETHKKGNDIVIGSSYDYFGRNTCATDNYIKWDCIYKYSRLPQYFKKVTSIYDEKGNTESNLAWLSFLVGNASLKRKIIKNTIRFDESLTEWGFEHFDFAYKLYLNNYRFFFNREAKNYHIPHSRSEGFYKNAINNSSQSFSLKFREINQSTLADFVGGNMSVELAKKTIYKEC